MADWEVRWLQVADLIATWSRDKSTKIGCVVVGPDNELRATGYNGLPRGVEYEPVRDERPEKYFWYEHAERNALYHAARFGLSLKGCSCYITAPPCADCARGIVQVGISHVYYPQKHPFLSRPDWLESFSRSHKILIEGGVNITEIIDAQDISEPAKPTITTEQTGSE